MALDAGSLLALPKHALPLPAPAKHTVASVTRPHYTSSRSISICVFIRYYDVSIVANLNAAYAQADNSDA